MRKIIICKNCGEEKVITAKGLCEKCYREQNKKICKKCGKLKSYVVKGLCKNCYRKQNLIICSSCGEMKPYYTKKLCGTCYQKQNLIICKNCGKLKIHRTNGLCTLCYNHKIGKNKPMNENKSCANYIGKFVKNKFLPKYFKNVKYVNFGDYNFICDEGYKIKVHISSHQFDKKIVETLGHWDFSINKNKISDYFLCIAIDNKIDLNIQHIWLIPAREINHLTGLGISTSKTDKWKIYEKDLNKAIKCCDIAKNEKKK